MRDDNTDLHARIRRAIAQAGHRDHDGLGPDDFQDEATAVLAIVDEQLAELTRLRNLLATGVREYGVRSVIDGRPSEVSEYGTEREAVLLRLQQPMPDGCEAEALTRRLIRTPWVQVDLLANESRASP